MRGTATRFVVVVLTTILLALQFPSPFGPFLSAHSAHASTVDTPGREYATCDTPDDDRDVEGPVHTRDRHRVTASGPTSDTPSRSLSAVDPAAIPDLSRPGGTGRAAHSSLAPSPAVLQVFRC